MGASGEVTARKRKRPIDGYFLPWPATRCALGNTGGGMRRSPHVGKRRALSNHQESRMTPETPLTSLTSFSFETLLSWFVCRPVDSVPGRQTDPRSDGESRLTFQKRM